MLNKFFFLIFFIASTSPLLGQSRFDSMFVGLDVNVPAGTYQSGHSPLAQGLPNALHEQKHDPAIGFRFGYEIPIGEKGFSSRFMIAYANHNGKHNLETIEGVIHRASTKHQIMSLSAGAILAPFLSNPHLYVVGDISLDAELLDVQHEGVVKSEKYDGKRIGLSAGVGHRFVGQSAIWGIEAGLKSTLSGSLDVNGNDYSKRSVLYISVSIHL